MRLQAALACRKFRYAVLFETYTMGVFSRAHGGKDKDVGAEVSSASVNGFLIPAGRVQSAQSLAYVQKNGLEREVG